MSFYAFGLVLMPKQGHLLQKLVIDSAVVFTGVEDGTGVFTVATPVELPKRSGGCYHVIAEVAMLDTTSCHWRATTCGATFAYTFEGPVFLMAGVYFVVVPAPIGRKRSQNAESAEAPGGPQAQGSLPTIDAEALLGQLERVHYRTLQRFCSMGPDAPFDQLLVSREGWMKAYGSGSGCRNAMFDRIKRCHLANAVAPATSRLRPDAFVFRAVVGAVARSDFVGPFGPTAVEGRHGAPVRLEVEVACQPKKGTVVIPVYLSVNGCVMFEFDDVKEQIANARSSLDRPMTCVVKAWQDIKIAGNGTMQVAFRYCKLDIVSLAVREGRTDVSVTVDALGGGCKAEISETSVLTATWISQVSGAAKSPQTVPIDFALLGHLEQINFQTLQRFCRMGPDAPFDQLLVSREEWMNAYASGPGSRNAMFERIKRCHLIGSPQAAASRRPKVNVEAFIKCIGGMSTEELQQLCDNPVKPYTTFLDAASFRRCWESGAGCRLSMLRSIAYSLGGHHPMINLMRRLNEDAAEIFDCLGTLPSYDPATLQKQCREGGAHLGLAVLKLTPEDWRGCYREGRSCRDEMVRAVATCVDGRVFAQIRVDDDGTVTGFLD